MLKEEMRLMYDCTCERCNYHWIVKQIPISCANCKTRSWNVKKKNATKK